MITIFSPMRAFESDIANVQLNAINSWINIKPSVEIILFEDEKNTTAAACSHLNVSVIKDVDRSFSGVPLLNSMYEIVNQVSSNDVICYLTADILLPKDFSIKINQFYNLGKSEFGKFVGISCRHDLNNSEIKKGNLSTDDYYKLCYENSHNRGRSGIDLWVTNVNDKIVYPEFPIGRCITDNWFVYYCVKNGYKVVDFSNEIKIIHQNHSKPSTTNKYFLLEKIYCHILFKNASYNAMDIFNSDFLYQNNSFSKPKGLRLIYYILCKTLIFRYLLKFRRKFYNKLYRIE